MAKKSKEINDSVVDPAFLSKAMEAFNTATEKLQISYSLLREEAEKLRLEVEYKNKELSDISELLNSILNNSRSAIIALTKDGIIIKNKACDRLIDEIGEENLLAILRHYQFEGIYEDIMEDQDGEEFYFRISVGELSNDNINGKVYVVDNITKIKVMEKENRRVENLSLMGEMVANIAHDIRNPLGSIELFISLLSKKADLTNDDKRLISNILKSVRVIDGIISNTLLFGKDMRINSSFYTLSDIVDDSILYLQHSLKDKNITIINKLNGEELVFCDKDLYSQVIMNLLKNAVDAVSDISGVITINSHSSKSGITLSISDNGPGISKAMKKKLFMPFQTTKAGGTGLGLSIAYKIIKAHKGEIIVRSDGKNYTSFDVFVPLQSVVGG